MENDPTSSQNEDTALNNEVAKKMAEAESAIKELNSFSYSVSHDLRAPLRILDGYSTILLEDYHDKLDDEGKRLLDAIKRNANKLNSQIDGLLNFSKLGQRTLEKLDFDMHQKVQSIVDQAGTSSAKKIKIELHPLTSVKADPALLEQVWNALISNAIKFSSKKENPAIEIGCTNEPTEIIYYIKDNGAGFDMQSAEKLFNVFQRLHKPSDFEGIGMGLAIVSKIIAKHAGRTWAEAKFNEGACFYFSLPVNQQ